jgi:hypothetical protein
MIDDEYWVDLCWDDDVLGGAFFVTRYYAMTLAECLSSLEVGARIVLRMVDELRDDVEGVVVDLQPEAGLALISVIARPSQVLPTPRMDHATKGDDWLAPYTPPRVRRKLRGTVDDVVHDHPQDGPCRVSIHLVTDEPAKDYAAFGGGPVERVTEEAEQPPLVGVLMSPTSPRHSLGPPNGVVATSIDSAMEVFPGLSAQGLARSLIADEPAPPHHDASMLSAHDPTSADLSAGASDAGLHAGAHHPSASEHHDRDSNTAVLDISPTVDVSAWSPDMIRDPVLSTLCTQTEDYLRFLNHLGETDLVDPLDLPAFRVQSVDGLTEALRAHQSLAGDKGGEA